MNKQKNLKDAGWIYQNNKWQKKNEKGKITTLSFNITVQSNNEVRIKVAENIKEQLEELGVEINIKKLQIVCILNVYKTKIMI